MSRTLMGLTEEQQLMPTVLTGKKACSFDVSYMHYGTFEGFDELGNSTANFTGNEVALGLASSHYFLQQDLHLAERVFARFALFGKSHFFWQ